MKRLADLVDINQELEYSKLWRTPLADAAGNGHLEVARFLVQRSAKVDKGYLLGPLHRAAQRGDLDKVKSLVKSVGVNNRQYDNRTPLCSAASNGKLEMVKFLVGSRAEVNAAYGYKTPLYCAAEQGHLKVVKLLVESGANVNETNRANLTPLWIAVSQGHSDVANFLIQVSADVNMRTALEATAIWIAAKQNHRQVVRFLTQSGAKASDKLLKGKTVAELKTERIKKELKKIEEVEMRLREETNSEGRSN